MYMYIFLSLSRSLYLTLYQCYIISNLSHALLHLVQDGVVQQAGGVPMSLVDVSALGVPITNLMKVDDLKFTK